MPFQTKDTLVKYSAEGGVSPQAAAELVNSMGMGVMGFTGNSMVADCHIEVAYTHTGGMPISMHTFCLSSRRASVRIYPDQRVEKRDDPNWFTPYYRRETVS